MTLDLPLAFPDETYRERLQALRDDLRREQLDGILLFDQASLFYLFGYDQLGYWVFQAVWVPVESDHLVKAICRAPDRALVENSIGIDECIVWLDDDSKHPTQTVSGWLVDVGAERVGVELESHALTASNALQLTQALGDNDIKYVDASDLVTARRSRKEPAELNHMRAAGHALDDAYAALGSIVSPGMRETELSALAHQTLLQAGCDPSAVPPCISAGKRTLSQTHLSAKPLEIGTDDLVTVELGAAIHRYHTVGLITYFMGGSREKYRDQYLRIVDAVYKGATEMHPGKQSVDIATMIHGALDQAGSSRRGRHVGYATGIGFNPTWLENLRIKDSQSYFLEPGMTFFLFAGAPTHDGAGHLGFGLPVAVTEEGPELLALADRGVSTHV